MAAGKRFRVQSKLDEKEKRKFEDIRQVIVFESQAGNRLTPKHVFAADEDKVTDSDVIRFLIKNFIFD